MLCPRFGTKPLGRFEEPRQVFLSPKSQHRMDWAHPLDKEHLYRRSIKRLILFTTPFPQEYWDLQSSLITLHVTRLGMQTIDKVGSY